MIYDIEKEKREAKYRGYRCIGGDEKLEELFKSGIKHAFVTLGFMGKADISEFDTFVENWKSQGGDQILKEINEELSK